MDGRGHGSGSAVRGRTSSQAEPVDWVFWSLLGAAVLSRVVWVLWVHPPREHVFSDMAHYVHRAGLVAAFEVEVGDRMMVWQAWGTHGLLAIPLLLLGPGQSALEFAGLMWASFSAATVVLGYQLAQRVLPGPSRPGRVHWLALAVGLALLGWVPLLSHTGFFVSEIPYGCALLATTLSVVRVRQDGRGALGARGEPPHDASLGLFDEGFVAETCSTPGTAASRLRALAKNPGARSRDGIPRGLLAAGLWGAFAFALRPQSAVFFGLLALAWVVERVRSGTSTLTRKHAVLLLAPLLVVVAISMVRVRVHTGRFGGVSENASMNLTAGRCHNIVTRAWSSEAELESAQQTGSPLPDRRVSLPGFRALAREGPDHPLALRPALGGEAIDLVGYIGDREVHREIRKRCYAATGVSGQIHYSITNVALLWLVARPWPESSDQAAPQLLPVAVRGRQIAAGLAPLGLLGMFLVLWTWARARGESRDRVAGVAVCALQLASLLIVAAVFFGDPRLRVPYDPYALILAVALLDAVLARVRNWV